MHEGGDRVERGLFILIIIEKLRRLKPRPLRWSWAGFRWLFVPFLSAETRPKVRPSAGARRRGTVLFIPPRPRARFPVMFVLRGPLTAENTKPGFSP